MKDKIFEESRRYHLLTIGFLRTIKNNFNMSEAFRLAKESFTNYMIEYYDLILFGTNPYSQERFDKFRDHYKNAASRNSYLQIIISTPNILKVHYHRCPFVEVMKHYDLKEFSYAYCLSDPGFTEVVLPGVRFQRENLISKGDRYCNHTWIFEEVNQII